MKSFGSDRVTYDRGTPKPQGQEHPDYRRNLETAQNFIVKTKRSLLRGVDVKISDGEHISKALLIISWSPPKNAPLGNYATPVNLHQNCKEVSNQIEGVFNTYMKSVASYENKHPKQLDMMDTALKV